MAACKVGPFHYFPSKLISPLTSSHVAFLFGWTDGKLRNVEKYATIYHNKGIHVYIMPSISQDFFYRGRVNLLVDQKTADTINSFKEKQTGIR